MFHPHRGCLQERFQFSAVGWTSTAGGESVMLDAALWGPKAAVRAGFFPPVVTAAAAQAAQAAQARHLLVIRELPGDQGGGYEKVRFCCDWGGVC